MRQTEKEMTMSLYVWESEWRFQEGKEASFLAKHVMDKPARWVSLVERRMPTTMQSTLEKAFTKAFETVFDKGSIIIEKTYNKDNAKRNYEQNQNNLKKEHELSASYKKFDRQAAGKTWKNLSITTVEGLGMGLFGVGIPDIPVFVSMLLKSIYEIAISYGFEYTSDKERLFILKMIDAALKDGNTLKEKNAELNDLIDQYHQLELDEWFDNDGECESDTEEFVTELQIIRQIDDTATSLSKLLLYGKFVQTITFVGVIGGAADITCLKRVTDYAKIKYKRRFLLRQGIKYEVER